MGRRGDKDMGSWGDVETRRFGDGETRRRNDVRTRIPVDEATGGWRYGKNGRRGDGFEIERWGERNSG